jgi:hypothetical protein
MKTRNWISSAVLACVLAGAGCGPSQKAGPQPMVINGVKVDLPKLRVAFPPENTEVQTSLNAVTMSIRYGQYAEAMAGLDKLAGKAGLTEPQKKVVADVLEQLKQVANQAPAKPAK